MRWLFILLLFVNVLYFGWEFNHQIKIDNKHAETPLRISSGAQRLKLLRESESLPVVRGLEEGENNDINFVVQGEDASDNKENTVFESADELVTDLPEMNIPSLPLSSGKSFCYTFGPVAEERLALELEGWFKSRRADTVLRHTDEKGKRLFWIYLSPQESRTVALNIIENLKQKGVSDYRLIGRGNLQNAISLGLFSSQAAVNQRLQELKKKGYKPVVIPYDDGKRVYWVDIALKVESKLLETIFKDYPSRYKSVPVNCQNIAMVQSTQ